MADISHLELHIPTLVMLGILSGAISTFAYLPYIIDTIRGNTRPQRASWLIWSILGAIAFFSQAYEGAGNSLLFTSVQVSGTIIVLLLSISAGGGALLRRSDCLVLCIAALGLLAWYHTDDASYALAFTIGISLLGATTTIARAYRDPDSETLSTWACSFIASIFAIASVGELNWVILAYPLYLLTLNGAIVAAIMLGRLRSMDRTTAFAQGAASI